MKTPALLRTCLALIATTSLLATTAPAQNKTNAPSKKLPAADADTYDVMIGSVNGHKIRVVNSDALTATFDINIQDGVFADTKKEATIGNLVEYLRSQTTNANFVLSPGTDKIRINDLKLRSADLKGIFAAVEIATGGAVSARSNGLDVWQLTSPSIRHERRVEVFNISGYLKQLGHIGDDDVQKNLSEIEQLIFDSLLQLRRAGVPSDDRPEFRFHKGTGLLIVTGPSDAMNITSKVINALPGQPQPDAKIRSDLLELSAPPDIK